MNILEQKHAPDTIMWDIWTSAYHLSALTAADELGIFACLKNKEYDIKKLADKLNINLRSTSILVDFLISYGLLIKKNDKIRLSLSAKNYLLPDSLFYWGSVLEPLRDRIEHKKIINAVRQGNNQLVFKNKSFTEMWQDGSITPDAANAFTRKMHATIFAPALEAVKSGVFSDTKKLLDVGGGSGCFSIAFTKAYKKSKALVFDLPAVCDITQKYITKYNATPRVSIHKGNFFIKDNWPHDYDGILLSQILHDWPIEKCKQILSFAYGALSSGGKIYIHEMLLNDNRTSPLATASFDLLMFINHQSQQFTNEELFNLLKSCGFSQPQTIQTFGYFSITVATKL